MVKTAPTLGQRVRGMVLGHAVGNVIGLAAAEDDGLRGLDISPHGSRPFAGRDTPASPWHADVALSAILAGELLRSPVDLRQLVERWTEWAETDGRGLDPSTGAALRTIGETGAPPAEGVGARDSGAVVRSLPVAAATLASPRNLVSGTYHIAALTHPDPRAAWAAVAVNVAAARLLSGSRDFVPDVIEVLRANAAPASLVEAVRRVPLSRRDQLPVASPREDAAVATAEIGLWFAYREPKLERGVAWLAAAGGNAAGNAALAGGLMGARDGEMAIPPVWLDAVAHADRLAALADRLVGEA